MRDAAAQAAAGFDIGVPDRIDRYGSGNINDSYRLIAQDGGDYLLQRINRTVFAHPDRIAHNLERLYAAQPSRLPEILRTRDGFLLHGDGDGEYWRLYRFVSGSRHMDAAATPEIAREAGRAFGAFLHETRNFPTDAFEETLPDFLDLSARMQAFDQALAADACNRAGHAGEAMAEVDRSSHIAAVEFPRDRIAHNDCKISNVLFRCRDATPRFAWSTWTPSCLAPPASISETSSALRGREPTRTKPIRHASVLDLARVEAIASGYCPSADLTSAERDTLVDGILYVTYMLAVRFLTDYLEGGTGTSARAYPEHNLDRASNQLALLRDIQGQRLALSRIVRTAGTSEVQS